MDVSFAEDVDVEARCIWDEREMGRQMAPRDPTLCRAPARARAIESHTWNAAAGCTEKSMVKMHHS